jgi:hypothetical protein
LLEPAHESNGVSVDILDFFEQQVSMFSTPGCSSFESNWLSWSNKKRIEKSDLYIIHLNML